MTINKETMDNLTKFDAIVRQQAARSVEVTKERKRLEAIRDNTENSKEEQDGAIKDLEKLEEAWKKERKGYDLQLFGGKDANGDKVGGFCDYISKDYYKAYCEYITKRNEAGMKEATQKFFIGACVEGTTVKDRSVKEFTKALLILLGGKFNSNSKLAKGEQFITTLNQRTFKKVVFGAILDIIDNSTIKTEKKDK
jgi:hypothetical protein